MEIPISAYKFSASSFYSQWHKRTIAQTITKKNQSFQVDTSSYDDSNQQDYSSAPIGKKQPGICFASQ